MEGLPSTQPPQLPAPPSQEVGINVRRKLGWAFSTHSRSATWGIRPSLGQGVCVLPNLYEAELPQRSASFSLALWEKGVWSAQGEKVEAVLPMAMLSNVSFAGGFSGLSCVEFPGT